MGGPDDYLSIGGVNSNLEYLQRSAAHVSQTSPLSPKENLYLTGYGRGFGEKLTYSTGLAYGTGIVFGGSYGAVLGLRKGGKTPKLFVNALLNSCATHGPGLANRAAVITMLYTGLNSTLVPKLRGADDIFNASISGALAGGLYKVTSPLKAAAKYSILSAIVFTAVDYGYRGGLY